MIFRLRQNVVIFIPYLITNRWNILLAVLNRNILLK